MVAQVGVWLGIAVLVDADIGVLVAFGEGCEDGFLDWRSDFYALNLERIGQHLLEGGIGERFDLFLGAVLDRIEDVDDGGLEAQRVALRGDAVDELGGDDVDARQAAIIEIVKVVQTARCAGASIA